MASTNPEMDIVKLAYDGGKIMNTKIVKESLRSFSEVLSFNYPAVGWYFFLRRRLKIQKHIKGILGLSDPVRNFIPEDMVPFSVP